MLNHYLIGGVCQKTAKSKSSPVQNHKKSRKHSRLQSFSFEIISVTCSLLKTPYLGQAPSSLLGFLELVGVEQYQRTSFFSVNTLRVQCGTEGSILCSRVEDHSIGLETPEGAFQCR